METFVSVTGVAAPMMQINDDFWENLNEGKTLEIIDRLASGNK